MVRCPSYPTTGVRWGCDGVLKRLQPCQLKGIAHNEWQIKTDPENLLRRSITYTYRTENEELALADNGTSDRKYAFFHPSAPYWEQCSQKPWAFCCCRFWSTGRKQCCSVQTQSPLKYCVPAPPHLTPHPHLAPFSPRYWRTLKRCLFASFRIKHTVKRVKVHQ